jgi:membrane protease YdiL (CAAX protease family)
LTSFSEKPEGASQSTSLAPTDALPAPASDAAVGPQRDPAWSGWDVLRILLMGAFAFFVSTIVLMVIVPGATLKARANAVVAHPELQIIGQMAVYLVVLGYMYVLVTRERGRPRFWEAIHWNWPGAIQLYLLIGIALQAAFLVIEWQLKRFMPKETPFSELLRRPYTLILIAVFSVTLGPLMEELFFRGFLYPVLRRRFGVLTGVLVTAGWFGLVHAAQYGYSWISISLIFIVGVVLAVVRETKNSVAAGFLVHAAYNGTIIGLLFAATDGFRHVEKLH